MLQYLKGGGEDELYGPRNKHFFTNDSFRTGVSKRSLGEACLNPETSGSAREIIDKLAFKHNVTPDEVEEVLANRPKFRFVEKGVIDCGITGNDWVAENESDVRVVTEMTYSKQTLVPFRWVVAALYTASVFLLIPILKRRVIHILSYNTLPLVCILLFSQYQL